MCCAFNQEAADKIFTNSKYTDALVRLESYETTDSFENSTIPELFDPTSQVGSSMGLTVMLDAHTDILAELSVTDDFEGFTAMVSPHGDFPLIRQRGFEVLIGPNGELRGEVVGFCLRYTLPPEFLRPFTLPQDF